MKKNLKIKKKRKCNPHAAQIGSLEIIAKDINDSIERLMAAGYTEKEIDEAFRRADSLLFFGYRALKGSILKHNK